VTIQVGYSAPFLTLCEGEPPSISNQAIISIILLTQLEQDLYNKMSKNRLLYY
jgi:hypothetical protein